MRNYFECSVRYGKTMENGFEKNVTEKYVVDAMSFSEAEAKATAEVGALANDGFTIRDIKRSNIAEVRHSDTGDIWFKCKVLHISLDEKSGKEKKTASYLLVQAEDINQASANLQDLLKGTISDYEIGSISDTKIVGIIEETE